MNTNHRTAYIWGAIFMIFLLSGCERPAEPEQVFRSGSIDYSRRTDTVPVISTPGYDMTTNGVLSSPSRELPVSRIIEPPRPTASISQHKDERSQVERQKLKDELKREIIAELRASGMLVATKQQSGVVSVTDFGGQRQAGQIRRSINAEGGKPVFLGQKPGGSVSGTILKGAAGIPGCRVKLVRLSKSRDTVFSAYVEGEDYVAVTNHMGRYVFPSVPAGAYKLKWQLPSHTGWIRRLRNRPDVRVRVGSSQTIKSVQTQRGLVNGG